MTTDPFSRPRPARLSPREALADAHHRAAIDDLNACFAEALDHGRYEDLNDLFTADAVYRSGATVFESRSAMIDSFVRRATVGPRTTRHLYSGLRVTFEAAPAGIAEPVRASSRSVWMSFAMNAQATTNAPLDEAVPFMVADFEDTYVLEADGHWRIASRIIVPVFRNPAAAPPART